MNQKNDHQPAQTTLADEFAPRQSIPTNLFRYIPFAGLTMTVWNRYLNLFVEAQQFAMRANQSILQFYGLPTNEDLSRINRQLFETSLRLDELETRLDEQEATHRRPDFN